MYVYVVIVQCTDPFNCILCSSCLMIPLSLYLSCASPFTSSYVLPPIKAKLNIWSFFCLFMSPMLPPRTVQAPSIANTCTLKISQTLCYINFQWQILHAVVLTLSPVLYTHEYFVSHHHTLLIRSQGQHTQRSQCREPQTTETVKASLARH